MSSSNSSRYVQAQLAHIAAAISKEHRRLKRRQRRMQHLTSQKMGSTEMTDFKVCGFVCLFVCLFDCLFACFLSKERVSPSTKKIHTIHSTAAPTNPKIERTILSLTSFMLYCVSESLKGCCKSFCVQVYMEKCTNEAVTFSSIEQQE